LPHKPPRQLFAIGKFEKNDFTKSDGMIEMKKSPKQIA
jgi:hypothetical protein